jgi:hypothetical protein
MKVIAVAPEASKYSVARFRFGAFAGMAATDRRYVADVKNTYKLLSLTNFHDVSVDASLKKLLAFSRA